MSLAFTLRPCRLFRWSKGFRKGRVCRRPSFGAAFHPVLPLNVDSVSEFRVGITNPNASFGIAGGAQETVTSRSGTNAYHGVLTISQATVAALSYSLPYIQRLGVENIQAHVQSLTRGLQKELPRLGIRLPRPRKRSPQSSASSSKILTRWQRGWRRPILMRRSINTSCAFLHRSTIIRPISISC